MRSKGGIIGWRYIANFIGRQTRLTIAKQTIRARIMREKATCSFANETLILHLLCFSFTARLPTDKIKMYTIVKQLLQVIVLLRFVPYLYIRT